MTTRHYIPEARTLHNHSCENLKSYILFFYGEAIRRYVRRFEKLRDLLATCFHAGFLLSLFFDLEDGGDILLRNVK
jgi:hypothetical protein